MCIGSNGAAWDDKMDWVKAIDGKVRLDGDELRDVLGTPYDYSVDDSTLTLTMYHVDAIVSAHGPKGAYMRNTAAELRALPHVVKARVKGNTITVEFDIPVEVG